MDWKSGGGVVLFVEEDRGKAALTSSRRRVWMSLCSARRWHVQLKAEEVVSCLYRKMLVRRKGPS